MTLALISYWQRLPSESPARRRKALATTIHHVRTGQEERAALVPYALGDVDDGIVADATRAYVGADVDVSGTLEPARAASIGEVTDWIRRGLAFNRGAIFGTLLSLEDEAINARLAALRLTLAAAEVETACRTLGPSPGPRAHAFLQDWIDLVADGPLAVERHALHRVWGAAVRARAA
jgi:hypothetical protein